MTSPRVHVLDDGVFMLALPFTRPLSLNDRMHRMAKASLTKEWLEATCWMVRAAKIPKVERIAAALHYVPRDNRRRDEDNLTLSFKPCVDALAKHRHGGAWCPSWVVPDDTKQYVDRCWPVIHPAISGLSSRFWLEVRLLGGAS